MIKIKHRVSYFTEGNIIEIIYDKRKLKKQIRHFLLKTNYAHKKSLAINKIFFVGKFNEFPSNWLKIKINKSRDIDYVSCNPFYKYISIISN